MAAGGKLLFDAVLSAQLLVLAGPILLASALAVRREDGGPVFYLGERVGCDGRPFKMFKFRTMVVDAERFGPSSTAAGDARITQAGRFLRRYKLDELPQLIKVLKYEVPLGKGVIRRPGKDLTIVATSAMVREALTAAGRLAEAGIEAEVIDPRTLKPLDEALICASVARTGRLVVVDAAWRTCGFAAEVAALAAERLLPRLTAPVRRVTLPDLPAPASRCLEECYYISAADIHHAAMDVMRQPREDAL